MKKLLLTIRIYFISALSIAQLDMNSQWTWIKGENVANSTGVYGTQGTADIINKPGARHGSITWKDGSGNLWLFGGSAVYAGTGGAFNDLWRYQPSTNQWTWIKGDNTLYNYGTYGTQGIAAVTTKPGARYGSVSWTDASGNLWMFGGSGYAMSNTGLLNDLWKYDPVTNEWAWIKGDNTANGIGVYGTQGLEDAANKPGARYGSVSWTDALGNLWLFGGRGYTLSVTTFPGNLNDLWKYNPTTNQWAWMNGDNTTGVAGVYGTQGIASASNKPGARYGSVSWKDISGNLWLFGGNNYFPVSGSFNDFNDLWKYNPVANQWTWMKGDNNYNSSGVYGTQGVSNAANNPRARTHSSSWTDALGNLWLFGGTTSNSVYTILLNDLWKYDPLINQWMWVKGDNSQNNYGVYGTQSIPAATNKPGARYSSVSWIDNSGNLWLFGGGGYAVSGSSNILNDLWGAILSQTEFQLLKHKDQYIW